MATVPLPSLSPQHLPFGTTTQLGNNVQLYSTNRFWRGGESKAAHEIVKQAKCLLDGLFRHEPHVLHLEGFFPTNVDSKTCHNPKGTLINEPLNKVI